MSEGEEDFYNSIRNREIAATRRLQDKFKHWHDSRATDAESGVFSGFAGIHYACYFHDKAALELLLKQQYKSLTLEAVKLPCRFISKNAKLISIPAGSDSLFICVATDFLEGAKLILAFYQGKERRYECVNRFGQTALHICALCRNDVSKYLVTNSYLLHLWRYQDSSDQCTTFLALAAQSGRVDVFSLIDQSFKTYNSQAKEIVASALLFSNEYGQDLEQFAYCEVNCDMFGTSREEKVRTAILTQKLMKMAHKWLSKRNSVQATETLQRWDEKQQLSGYSARLCRIAREISLGQSTEDFMCLGDSGRKMRQQFLSNVSVGYI